MRENLCERLLFCRKVQSGNIKVRGKRRKVSEIRFLHIRYKYKEYRIKISGRVLDFGLNFHQCPHNLGKCTQTETAHRNSSRELSKFLPARCTGVR